MFRTVNDFLEDWKYESESTLKIFNSLTDETLNQEVTPEGRSIKDLAWHITMSNGEMIKRTGLGLESFDENAEVPIKLSEITSEYDRLSKMISELVKNKWNDNNLTDEVDMYGEMWKKGKVLSVIIKHQIHHRAQITILMRQANLKVPGIYGPSKEEWAAYGLPPQK